MNAKLITAQEALQLYEHMKFDEWEDAGEIAAAFAKRFKGSAAIWDCSLAASFMPGACLASAKNASEMHTSRHKITPRKSEFARGVSTEF